jgi:DNA-binding FrmR family transcriptional regulator
MSQAKHTWIDQKKLIERAKKVEGQAVAVRRMIEEDRHCSEILQQVAALNSAAQRLAVLLLEDHVQARIQEGVPGEAIADETATLVGRILKI